MTRRHERCLASAVSPALLCCAAALAAGLSGAALAVTGRMDSQAGVARHPSAPAGINLLDNPGAQTGAASVRGWDSVTIPGWQVSSGLPTVVRYGTSHFPGVTGQWPAVQDGQMFAGGAGGAARLRQLVPLRSSAGRPVPAGTRYRLGLARRQGTQPGRGDGGVRVCHRTGARTAGSSVRPARPPGPWRAGFPGCYRTLPAGHGFYARITVVLATSLTNIDGPDAPYVGYDRAVADALGFTVSSPGPAAPRQFALAAGMARSAAVSMYSSSISRTRGLAPSSATPGRLPT